jgi:hypothetical protein
MRTGHAMVEVVSVFCPHCREAFDQTKNGSTMIVCEDGLKGGTVVACNVCRERYRLPKAVEWPGTQA